VTGLAEAFARGRRTRPRDRVTTGRYATFDEPATRHAQVADRVIEKAKRLVEHERDVVILLGSIARLARAHNTVVPHSGKILAEGVDSNAMYNPKAFFGAARSLPPRSSRRVALSEPSLRQQVDHTLYMPQVCRGLACLLVAVYHGAALVGRWYGETPLHGLTEFGFSGVHIFFVISGLIIYHAHRRDLNDPRSARRYLQKRFVRIYPFYWIVLLMLGGGKLLSGRLEIDDFLTNALFFSSSKPLVVAVSWTLAYEMIFYGLFVAFLVQRSLGVAVFAAWFALVVLNHHYAFYPFGECVGLDLINLLFLFGLLTSLAVIALRDGLQPSLRDRIGLASLVAGIAVFACTAWYFLSLPDRKMGVWYSLPLTLGFGTSSALMLLASVSGTIEGFLKRQRLLLLIGDASYAVYLVHFYLQKRTFYAIRSLDWVPSGETTQASALLLLAAIMIASVGGGILIHRLIEKPVLTRTRQWLGIGASTR
jgi:peptidoglycan/LPS O-acetylase OafA/YrhL